MTSKIPHSKKSLMTFQNLYTQWTKKIIDETFHPHPPSPNKSGSDTSVIYCVNKIRSA